MRKIKEDHATRFLQILLGYKSCYGYITMTEQYGCHCGLHKRNCSTSQDCLDDCCRYDCYEIIHGVNSVKITSIFRKKFKTNFKLFVLLSRKHEQCRKSINISSIKCSGYEPYEYSWAHNETNGRY